MPAGGQAWKCPVLYAGGLGPRVGWCSQVGAGVDMEVACLLSLFAGGLGLRTGWHQTLNSCFVKALVCNQLALRHVM